MAGPYTDEQIINFIIELRTRPNNPLTENEAIAAVQDTYGISDERISQIENLLFQQSSVFFTPLVFLCSPIESSGPTAHQTQQRRCP